MTKNQHAVSAEIVRWLALHVLSTRNTTLSESMGCVYTVGYTSEKDKRAANVLEEK